MPGVPQLVRDGQLERGKWLHEKRRKRIAGTLRASMRLEIVKLKEWV